MTTCAEAFFHSEVNAADAMLKIFFMVKKEAHLMCK